jgi:hypothetical protein
MAATSFLLLVLVPVLLFALFWRIDRNIADPDPGDGPVDPDETDLVVHQVAAADRLRREAAATTDPEEKASLTRLADEADADAEKLRNDR